MTTAGGRPAGAGQTGDSQTSGPRYLRVHRVPRCSQSCKL